MLNGISSHIIYPRAQTSDPNIYYSKAIAARFIPNLTEQDFWDAVYDFDPLAPDSPPVTRLQQIMYSGQLKTLTLGKIYGRTTLKLIPCEGALPTTETQGWEPGLEYADTDCGAVSYSEGHPAACKDRETADMLEGRSVAVRTIGDDEDETLRRFASLGYVIQESKYVKGAWMKTGHVLVIDMGLKRVRKRHPWFVLAHEWPTDGEETEDGNFEFHAKERVLFNDSGEAGVFPGDNNRTPICRIDAMNKTSNRPVIRQFGSNFNFKPYRLGGLRPAKPSPYGPALVHVMEWHWDPEAERQVCYSKDGREYMRYDPQTHRYSYPDYSRMNFGEGNG